MSLLELIHNSSVTVYPGLSSVEIRTAEEKLRTKFPAPISQILSKLGGFESSVGRVDFSGLNYPFEFDFLEGGIPILADGMGNFWVVDRSVDDRCDLPVAFASHDPPVLLFQFENLADFVSELLISPRKLVEAAHELTRQIDTGKVDTGRKPNG